MLTSGGDQFKRLMGLHSLEPLFDAAATYEAALAGEEARSANGSKSVPTPSTTEQHPSTDATTPQGPSLAQLADRVISLTRPPRGMVAMAWGAAINGLMLAWNRYMTPRADHWINTIPAPAFAPSPSTCQKMCFVKIFFSVNMGYRILCADAIKSYDYYVRNGLRRRARCFDKGVAQIVCPIARLVSFLSGSQTALTAGGVSHTPDRPVCPAGPPLSPRLVAVTTVATGSSPAVCGLPLGIPASVADAKTADSSRPSTALATPRSASLRTRSFMLPDDVDATIGVAAAQDSDDTAWETDAELVESATGRAARLSRVRASHHHHHRHDHRRQLSFDSLSVSGEKQIQHQRSASSSSFIKAQTPPVVLADPTIDGVPAPMNQQTSTIADSDHSHGDTPSGPVTPSVVTAATPLLSRAAFIVRFEQHRRTATRLYLAMHVGHCIAAFTFRRGWMPVCLTASGTSLAILFRLRHELSFVDCSARASVNPVIMWNAYMFGLLGFLLRVKRAEK